VVLGLLGGTIRAILIGFSSRSERVCPGRKSFLLYFHDSGSSLASSWANLHTAKKRG
jgi:hypothetical protein